MKLAPISAAAANIAPADAWVFAILRVAGYYGIGTSPEHLRQSAIRVEGGLSSEEIQKLCRDAGMNLTVLPKKLDGLNLPAIAVLQDGQTAVLETRTVDGFIIAASGDNGLTEPVTKSDLAGRVVSLHAARPASRADDPRVAGYGEAARGNWLRDILFADRRPYRGIALASLVGNVLALGGILFSMQVYDRVVPAQSLPTLWVLFGGVMMATAFGFIMRKLRSRVTDVMAKRTDLTISSKVFGHALRVRGQDRPRSTGTFIAQIRDLEQMRDMFTSSTVSMVADLPFFLLFSVMFFAIAGNLVWVPVVAAIAMILPGVLAQPKLKRLANQNMRESAVRNALLIEAVQAIDDIKTMQAESRYQSLWHHANTVLNEASLQSRELVNGLTNWSQTVQQAVFAVVIFFGAPQVMTGDLSTGVLVAASMLSTRMIAPLGSVAQILNRWQQAKAAHTSIDQLLSLPTDGGAGRQLVHRPALRGAFKANNVIFSWDKDARPALMIKSLEIKPGERIAILGRNGSGKSTLLAGLSGLISPSEGELRLDDVAMSQIDPADIRRDIGWLGQTSRLVQGTLRENLRLGAPHATDEEILAVLNSLGMAEFVQRLERGLDHPLQEGGLGMSGGQRQNILLARLLLRRPRVLLLDEPTAALDDSTEAMVIDTLSRLDPATGIIIATHRTAVLRMVDRLIVTNQGQIVLDGPRDTVLAHLRGGKNAA